MTRAQRVVIYGSEGIGKSTLAACNMPSPLFLDTEDGTTQLDVDRVAVGTLEELSNALKEVLAEQRAGSCEYKSVVLDTADRLWTLCADAVCRENSWKSIEAPGFGKGYAMAAERFRLVFAGFDALMRAGLHVCVICHAKVDRITPPDNAEYNRYCIKVCAPSRQAEASREFIKEWCDALLFCRYDIVVDSEEKRALGREARRVIATTPSPAWEAKNRFGLPAELPMEAGVLGAIFAGCVASGASKAADASCEPKSKTETEQTQGEQQDAADKKEQRGATDTEVKLSNGKSVSIPNGYLRVLVEFFVSSGKLNEGEGLEELDVKLADALVARPEQALAAARKWKEQKGGAA